tara:strand:- start:187 stop:363 length:177 start_codon:yes stop_codon:yes gene_type:complete
MTWQVIKDIEIEEMKKKKINMCIPTDTYTKEKFKEWCNKNNYTMTKYIRNHIEQVCGL